MMPAPKDKYTGLARVASSSQAAEMISYRKTFLPLTEAWAHSVERRARGTAVVWPLLPPLPLFIASQTAQDWVNTFTGGKPNQTDVFQQPLKSSGSDGMTSMWLKAKIFWNLRMDTKVNMHQASSQTKPNQFNLAKQKMSLFQFSPGSPFWVYFVLSGEETKEDGAVWRIREVQRKTRRKMERKKKTELVEYLKNLTS